jgi:uncharacterized protein YggE
MSEQKTVENTSQVTKKPFIKPKLAIIILSSFLLVSLVANVFLIISNFYFSPFLASSINQTSTVKQEYAPDTLNLNFTVSSKNQEAALANQEVDEKSKKIIDLLTSKKVLRENIKTNKNTYATDPGIAPEPLTAQKPEKIENIVENYFQVTITDVQEKTNFVNQLIKQILDFGGISNLNHYTDIKNKTEICQDLEKKALKKAKEDALAKVKIIGAKRIVSINLVSVYGCQDGGQMYLKRDIAASSPEMGSSETNQTTEVMLGKQEIFSTVEIQAYYR